MTFDEISYEAVLCGIVIAAIPFVVMYMRMRSINLTVKQKRLAALKDEINKAAPGSSEHEKLSALYALAEADKIDLVKRGK